MKTGWDSTRRNRNIGTPKQGHGSYNKLVIAENGDLNYWENLRHYNVVNRYIGEKRLTFIVEKTRKDSFHSCTIDDITHILRHVPSEDLQHIDLVVLRQPKRKEEILDSAWGRAAFHVEIGNYSGAAVILETMSILKPIRWLKSLKPGAQVELERLSQDGHIVTTTKHHHIIESTIESVRSTQLYRTLLHEIGHHIDFDYHWEHNWSSRSSVEKEAFAHKYADTYREKLSKEGVIPFDRVLDISSMERDGLLIDDFS